MSELETGNESDVSSESSVSSEPNSSVQAQETAPAQEAQATPAPKEQPFNEHPRFKEIIAERNQEREQRIKDAQEMAVLRSQLEQLKQQQAPKNEKPSFDPLFDRLKGIDPEFAELIKSTHTQAQQAEALKQELAEIKQWRNEEEKQRNSQIAISSFDKLCTDNKVSEQDKELYRQAVTNMSYARNASIKDLPALFSEAHQNLSKYFENRDRALRESYVKAKKSDGTPATQTGGVPASGKANSSGPMTLDEVKAAVANGIRTSGGFHNI